MTLSTTEELAQFITQTTFSDLPREVIRRTQVSMVDGIGVMLAGSTDHCARIIQDELREAGCQGTVSVLGTSLQATAAQAALANGLAGHAMDFDDTQLSSTPDRIYGLLTHPTVPVLGAALAVAEAVGASGRDLLAAQAVGVEVACKIAEAINPYHYANGFHSSGTIGVFGATAAASWLLNLSYEQVRYALGIAASSSAGIRAGFGTMAKPLHVGRAAEHGVKAAQLARRGFKSDPNALDGRWGFFQVAGGGYDQALIHGKLGRPYSSVEPGISIKPYPCGSLSHPSMDTLLDLIREEDISAEAAQEVRIRAGANIINPLRYLTPQNELEAKFSLPFCLGILVLERRAGIEQFRDEVVQRRDVRAMMERVKVIRDETIEAQGFERMRSIIEVELKDGQVLRRESAYSRGSPQRPMTPAELAAKFTDCARLVYSEPDRIAALLEAIDHLEETANVQSFMRALA
jgi:2-methylcitrate dehydratase PrpD